MNHLTPDPQSHALDAEAALARLESNLAVGLAPAEVEARLRRFGPNRMTARKRVSEGLGFLLQFHQPLIYVLLASGAPNSRGCLLPE